MSGLWTWAELYPLMALGKAPKDQGSRSLSWVGKSPSKTWRKVGDRKMQPPERKLLTKSLLLSPAPRVSLGCQQWPRAGTPQMGRGKCDKGVAGQEEGEWPAGGQVLAGMERRTWGKKQSNKELLCLKHGPSAHNRVSC